MNNMQPSHRSLLASIARQAMLDRGLTPDYSAVALAELDTIREPARIDGNQVRDLSTLIWASIDNDDSRDLDQLTVAEALPGGRARIRVAVADVDALVKKGSAIDGHADANTTSVYTAGGIFSMLPEKLSTGLTSLNPGEDRLAIVIEMDFSLDASLRKAEIYRALVRNQAQLAYNSVAAWLEAGGTEPEAITHVPGLAENLRLQDRVAQEMKSLRHTHGALSLETIQSKAIFDGDQVLGLEVDEKNRAKEIIEDFMIAANGVVARYLESRQFPSLRRVVRNPRHWDRIVEIAAEHHTFLPAHPDARPLEEFLNRQRIADPIHFPDLSLSIIKLIGPGEYAADFPGDVPPGHFGLAVKDYTHSTAPNRRYTDLVTHRLLKSALGGETVPYQDDELIHLAQHCTEQEDAAEKVERQVGKSAAALLLQSRIGERFEAIVTGASPKGTWVRLLTLPVEGKLVQGYANMRVGHRVQVRLVEVNVEKGFIDFVNAGR